MKILYNIFLMKIFLLFFSINLFFQHITPSFLMAVEKWQTSFQAPATPVAEGIIIFHNLLMIPLITISIFVFWLLIQCLTRYNVYTNKHVVDNFTHATNLEITWTIVPALILAAIAAPSFSLLYCMDEMLDPSLTFKIIGHQWYWSYEFSDYIRFSKEGENFNFDSYMLSTDDLDNQSKMLRLLEVDNRLVLPVSTHIRALISSADVLHSWAVPSFGIKVDACPGRLNESTLLINHEGVFYGQCSELCGINHGFMPIAVEVVNFKRYLRWLNKNIS